MKQIIGAVLLAGMSFIGACGAQTGVQEQGESAAWNDSPWTVTIETSGGITGRGLGSARVTSAGQVSATDMSRACEDAASPDRIAAIRSAIARSEPERWNEAYLDPQNPHGNADMIEYVLTVSSGDRKHTTRWYDGTRGAVPTSIQALSDRVWEARASLLETCGGAKR